MPFLTDTTWPAGLRTIFDTCSQEDNQLPLENPYLGPYITLLTYCFGLDSFDFFVAPQAPEWDLDNVDLGLYLIIFDARCRPVLIADIKEGGWVNRADLRVRADSQIRRRFNLLAQDSPLPRFWGLSLLGTSLRVYSCNFVTQEIEPLFIHRPSPGRALPRSFLGDAWNVDILSQEGFTKMKEVVQDILTNAKTVEKA